MQDVSEQEISSAYTGGLRLLSVAFQLAVESVLETRMSGDVDEELTTGALLGGIAAHSPWLHKLASHDGLSSYIWTNYRRSGKDSASEPLTGADFALILKVAKDRFRVAVFQAKRAGERLGAFRAFQLSPARPGVHPEPQIIRLLSYANNAEMSGSVKESLSWVHYLGYQKRSIFHEPLSCMGSYMLKIKATNKYILSTDPCCANLTRSDIEKIWSNVRIKRNYKPESGLSPWIDLIKVGCLTPPDEEAAGWMVITGTNAAEAFIRATAPFARVYEGATSLEYAPIFRGADFECVTASIRDISVAVRGSNLKYGKL